MSNEHVLLLGPPGAGKGTQSKRLAAEFDLEHVTTGDALRANKHMETEYGTPASFMDAGELVPDPVVNEIVKTALEDADGYVLDGYPRNLDQVEYLDSVTELDYVFYLAVDEDELVRRLTGRRVCPDCGATFHTEFDQPEEEGVCDECGAELTQRDDDTEDTVRERLRVYHENTAPVVEHYRETGTLVEVEGEGTPDEVFDELATELRD
ncbi:Adenylate kinase [Halogranum gelatinilyticum]|uniref:Adenylate kinase n=1 Tax=Halogranum gelatinilyticum TaxID=660521 RepID=A0A1G9TI15_9EURY|nr:adenylate kinase [Halogranum gelatinilyticum]SDM47252.1 Adenylate kinase [Halogranum gelatinilyticum]